MDTTVRTIDGKLFDKLLTVAARNLQANIGAINDLNVFPVPDGDTGTNMYATLIGGVDALHTKNTNNIGEKSNALADGMLLNARGNSGVILSQLFFGIAKGLSGIKAATLTEFSNALIKGVEYAYKAVIKPVEGTILTVAREAAERVSAEVSPDETIEEFFNKYLIELKLSLDRTPELLEVLKESGVVDSGGAGLVCIAEGFCKAILGEDVSVEIASTISQPQVQSTVAVFDEYSKMDYGYCTEILLQLLNEKNGVEQFNLDALKTVLTNIGDSVVAVQSGTKVKVHVHTLMPALVITECQKFGEFISVKIENMTVQHNSLLYEEKKKVKTAIVVVASGQGFASLYCELGADYIVSGGQTDNPSTEDFIKGFDEVNAENIIVLPNNKNIVLAAKQAAELYKNAKVTVLETKTPQQVYSALMVVTDKNNTEALINDMQNAYTAVESLSITYAVRDAHINGIDIKEGDYMAFSGGKLLLEDSDILSCFKRMLLAVDGIDDKEIVTVFYGKTVTEDDMESVREIVEDICPDAELMEYEGGQEVYPFIVALE